MGAENKPDYSEEITNMFSLALREGKRVANLDIIKIAKMIQRKSPTINRFFNGKIDPRLSEGVALAKVLDIDLNYFKKYVPDTKNEDVLLEKLKSSGITEKQVIELGKILGSRP